jgi:hypothetical protein
MRCGGLKEDQAVRQGAPALFSRFSLISMVSRFEVYAQNLLLQRRVLEYLKGPEKRMNGPNLWRILTQVQKESRSGPVKMCDGMIVVQRSEPFKQKMEWLEGLYRVRNCLAHRLGKVQIVDVKPAGVSIDETKDTDTLKALWLRPRMCLDGAEVQLPYFTKNAAQATFDFEPVVREWKIGEEIDVTPVDCQAIGISLSLLGSHLQDDFEREMNELLGISSPASPSSV